MVADGRLLALNSYENRVYQVGIEDGQPVVAKFYRPERWSDAALQEEHDFATELAGADIPAVAPLRVDGATLHDSAGFRFAVYPRRGGHWPELDSTDRLTEIGRLIGRLHAIGSTARFVHRPDLSVESFGYDAIDTVIDAAVVPAHIIDAYESVAEDLIETADNILAARPATVFRLHGDLHPSNVLDRDGDLHLVDFDDARNGPAVQDLWMFLSGDRDTRLAALDALLSGYTVFNPFDVAELELIEAYRALRIVHYAAWLTRRFDDPAFQRAFPWFAEPRYWEEHVLALREQRAALDDPALYWLV